MGAARVGADAQDVESGGAIHWNPDESGARFPGAVGATGAASQHVAAARSAHPLPAPSQGASETFSQQGGHESPARAP